MCRLHEQDDPDHISFADVTVHVDGEVMTVREWVAGWKYSPEFEASMPQRWAAAFAEREMTMGNADAQERLDAIAKNFMGDIMTVATERGKIFISAPRMSNELGPSPQEMELNTDQAVALFYALRKNVKGCA